MTPLVWSWLLSLTGALSFFAAGAAYTARRFGSVPAGQPLAAADSPALEPTVHDAEERRAALERELAQRTAERQQLFRELEIERSARLESAVTATLDVPESAAGARGDSIEGLRHELALVREELTARDAQLETLRDENVRLRAFEEDSSRTRKELATLNEQMRALRAQAFIAKPAPTRTKTLSPTLSATGRALQTIVDTETRSGRAKTAVIADELGLLVAASSASSEYNDALAALGAYLADVGSKTRDILPLHKLRQVVVSDDHDLTLTVRPLATDDPGLALVTLAVQPTSSANDNRKN